MKVGVGPGGLVALSFSRSTHEKTEIMTAYRLDPSTTQLRFRARGLWGAVPVTGSFGRAEGQLTLRERTAGAIEICIDAASIETGLCLRDNYLRGERFLHVREYPTIASSGAVSNAPDGLLLDGSLTVRGREVPQVLQVATFGASLDLSGAITEDIDLDAFEFTPPFGMVRRDVRLELRGAFRQE
ncbi:YceI family protein [Rhodococcus corynebacterioides]|nr:YceI family protein [Rhodococcus corynebacterioides]